MRRQEVLLNLTLLTLIGALVYTILQSGSQDDDLLESMTVASVTEKEDSPGGTETPYLPERDVYNSFGKKPLFKALITPTPSPTPPPPPPAPTPNIHEATANLKVTGIMDNVAYVEPKKPDPEVFPDGVREMKAGDTLMMPVGKSGEKRQLTLKTLDEITNPDNPSATWQLDGTTEEKVLRMFDDPAPPQ